MKNAQIEVTNKKGKATIRLTGDLSIVNTNYIAAQLREAMESFSSFHLLISDVSAIDLSLVQLLVAFKKSAFYTDKPADVDLLLTDENKSILVNTGLWAVINNLHIKE